MSKPKAAFFFLVGYALGFPAALLLAIVALLPLYALLPEVHVHTTLSQYYGYSVLVPSLFAFPFYAKGRSPELCSAYGVALALLSGFILTLSAIPVIWGYASGKDWLPFFFALNVTATLFLGGFVYKRLYKTALKLETHPEYGSMPFGLKVLALLLNAF